jgi:hypothetical protein
MKMYSILSGFISRLAAFLVTNTACVSFFTMFMFQNISTEQIPPSFLETSSVIFKPKLKNSVQHLLFQTILRGTPAGLIFNLILSQ